MDILVHLGPACKIAGALSCVPCMDRDGRGTGRDETLAPEQRFLRAAVQSHLARQGDGSWKRGTQRANDGLRSLRVREQSATRTFI